MEMLCAFQKDFTERKAQTCTWPVLLSLCGTTWEVSSCSQLAIGVHTVAGGLLLPLKLSSVTQMIIMLF